MHVIRLVSTYVVLVDSNMQRTGLVIPKTERRQSSCPSSKCAMCVLLFPSKYFDKTLVG